MTLMGFSPAEAGLGFSYRFAWLMDKDLCFYFIDALISNTLAEDGKFGALTIREDTKSEQYINLREEFLANRGDIFATLADRDVAAVGVALCPPDESLQFFIEVACDKDWCNVCVTSLADDIEVTEEYAPDLLLSRSEIMAHIAMDRCCREDETSAE